jgi:hypothetical protein
MSRDRAAALFAELRPRFQRGAAMGANPAQRTAAILTILGVAVILITTF